VNLAIFPDGLRINLDKVASYRAQGNLVSFDVGTSTPTKYYAVSPASAAGILTQLDAIQGGMAATNIITDP
jgi:hypothetical protein